MVAMVGSALAYHRSQARAGWMGKHFEALRDRTLLQITLPGSHNSGNYLGGLSAEHLCASDYRYDDYRRVAEATQATPLTRSGFDAHMIPWNVNHFTPIAEQLTGDGARFFHLKICNFGQPGARSMDLTSVRFQHRGYTTQETLASTLKDMEAFLAENPKELIVLGLNNLHSAAPGGFGQTDVLALAEALAAEIGEGALVRRDELLASTLGELIAAGKRFVVFLKGPSSLAEQLPPGIILSSQALTEDWDDVMASGDLAGSAAWLAQDVREQAIRGGRFHVLQANPNNAEDLMYNAMISGQGPQSNAAFLASFLRDLPSLVSSAVSGAPGARINAVSTDFLSISKPYDIAMKLMGLEAVA